MLFPTRLIGMDQIAVAHLRQQLLFEHRLQRTGALVEALVDRRHAELQPEPVAKEFLNPPSRQAHAQGECAQQRNQQRSDQVALTERHAPSLVPRTVARLGARPMPTGALPLVVDVLDLEHFHPAIRVGGFTQINRQRGAVDPLRAPRGQPRPAHGTLPRVVMFLMIDRQALRTPMTGRAWLLPRWPPGARLTFRSLCCSARLLFLALLRPRLLAAFPARLRAVFLLLLWLPLPRRLAARGPGAVARILIKALVSCLQIGEQLHRQHAHLLLTQSPEGGFVELEKVVSGKLHFAVRP
ncbi:MAG: hypothetical protein WCA32_04310 [Chromatiaceae bacterium]